MQMVLMSERHEQLGLNKSAFQLGRHVPESNQLTTISCRFEMRKLTTYYEIPRHCGQTVSLRRYSMLKSMAP